MVDSPHYYSWSHIVVPRKFPGGWCLGLGIGVKVRSILTNSVFEVKLGQGLYNPGRFTSTYFFLCMCHFPLTFTFLLFWLLPPLVLWWWVSNKHRNRYDGDKQTNKSILRFRWSTRRKQLFIVSISTISLKTTEWRPQRIRYDISIINRLPPLLCRFVFRFHFMSWFLMVVIDWKPRHRLCGEGHLWAARPASTRDVSCRTLSS